MANRKHTSRLRDHAAFDFVVRDFVHASVETAILRAVHEILRCPLVDFFRSLAFL